MRTRRFVKWKAEDGQRERKACNFPSITPVTRIRESEMKLTRDSRSWMHCLAPGESCRELVRR